ncbi:fimbrial protein [Dyella soli]|uniref:Type 1 fimbrial protein n=1 Tax=Dyella soli TaxID=522319 RepID=A0A4R0YLY3_9GAMM|nr:fimbrial protein [Dyella soli]TCI06719.1 type 1 fimbrial protein [Dyella soli]
MNSRLKKLLALAIVAAPLAASAATGDPALGTITFQGMVTDQTCSATINGVSGNATVALPTVTAATLAGANSTAGATPFTLGVTGCNTASVQQTVLARFQGVSVDANGNLSNTAAGGATNVALQLMDSVGGTPISLSAGAANVYAGWNVAGQGINLGGAASGTHNYGVQYISVPGGATAGKVIGATQYAITYQ